MAISFNGSTRLELNTAVVPGPPVTMSVWFRPARVHPGYLCAVGGVLDSERMGLFVQDDGSLMSITKSGGVAVQPHLVSTTSYTVGDWGHASARWEANGVRSLFLNGVLEDTQGGPSSLVGLNRTVIGARPPGAFYFDGGLAEVAIWSASLDDSEIDVVASGVSPLALTDRLRELKLYQPLINAPNSWRVGGAMTVFGSPSVLRHPRTLRAGGAVVRQSSAAVRQHFHIAATTAQASGSDQGLVALAGQALSNIGIAGEVVS